MTLAIGAVLMLGGVALQATAASVIQFVGARALVGAGLIFGTNAAPLLITELAYPTQRGKITSLYNSLWYGGSIAAAWSCLIAYNAFSDSNWSWRAPILVQALGPLLQIFLIWLVPESPRWLISKGLESKASRILARFHATGFDERDPFVQYELAQIRRALRMEKEMNDSASYATLFITPGNRKRMRIIVGIALFSQWSGNGLGSYYINLVLEGIDIKDTRTKAMISGCLQIWNLAAAIMGALLVDKLGRRTLFIASNAGMLMTLPLWALTSSFIGMKTILPTAQAAKATIPFIFAFYFFYGLAYTPVMISYTLEILPYSIRAKGFALMNLVVSLALAFNQFVDPWALSMIGWKYYLIYCAWLGFELVFVIVYIVETRGRTLEETAALFDTEEKLDTLLNRDSTIISLQRLSPLDGGHNDDSIYSYTGKGDPLKSYELQRPHLVLGRDRMGHTKGRNVVHPLGGQR